MTPYPLFIELKDRLCVVVGGGSVGRRKMQGLVTAGARVRMVDPLTSAEPLPPGVELLCRAYRPGDLAGAVLAFAATDRREVNAAVARDARSAGIPVNVADSPDESDFTVPALLRRGALTVAVATEGQSPALAALVRDEIAACFGSEWGTLLEIAAALRRKRLTPAPHSDYNQRVFRQLLDAGLAGLVAAGDVPAIDRLLTSGVDEETTLAVLGVGITKGRT
jgi:precorrin-2 dehydrogenase/sirohydrochlorin ferrochelatase